MPNDDIVKFKNLLIKLTGRYPKELITDELIRIKLFKETNGIGHSQFNEILLLLGYNRVCEEFFQFLVNGETTYEKGAILSSLNHFEESVKNFQRIALLFFGSIENAFKELSQNKNQLNLYLSFTIEREFNDFRARKEPILEIDQIDSELTYYLGYLIRDAINKRLAMNPNDKKAQEQEKIRKEVIKRGEKNHEAYLTSDHLDVYVATSMRLNHEYVFVNETVKELSKHKSLADLKLRFFDPTQAYCEERIDKGLSEALMLKRAKCTVYLIQESDTLGKDSELATTLAQGKPVIAYIPKVNTNYVDNLIKKMKVIEKEKKDIDLLLEQFRLVKPNALWEKDEKQLREWIIQGKNLNEKDVKKRVVQELQNHYNKRANILKDDHPLGIQVNLSTGVANGVLVVRTINDCAELIKRVITKTLKFEVETKSYNKKHYYFLKEEISKCVFRVVSGDELLTNSFWNFYLQ